MWDRMESIGISGVGLRVGLGERDGIAWEWWGGLRADSGNGMESRPTGGEGVFTVFIEQSLR